MTRGLVLRVFCAFAIVLGVASSASAQTETVEYYGTDAVGSIRIVFTPTGAVLARQDYGPFGQPLASAPQQPPERFGAQTTDDEVQQSYFHARQFQSRTGRFATTDSVFDGIFDPQQWNRYVYAENNPLSDSDFGGLDVQCGEAKAGDDLHCSDSTTVTATLSPAQRAMDASTSETLPGLILAPGGPGGFHIGLRQPPRLRPVKQTTDGKANTNADNKTSPGSDNVPQCGSQGGGVVISTGVTVEGGLGVAGASVQGSVGYGVFYDSDGGLSGSHVASGTAVAYSGPASMGTNRQNSPNVVGGFAGASLFTVTVTSAHSAGQLVGSAETHTVNVGTPDFGFSIAYGGGSVSAGLYGPSAGASVSHVTTVTTVDSAGACR